MRTLQRAPRATGYSAKLLDVGFRAIAIAQDCPCGRKFLKFISSKENLRDAQFRLCRKGYSRKWLHPLLEAGIVWWTPDCGKRSITIYLQTPLQIGVAKLKREKKTAD
ncbi:MAG: hypothetical protein AAB486_03305 [Patescibacteria group bacterium]